jgi:CRP-like cAMP-binding protein
LDFSNVPREATVPNVDLPFVPVNALIASLPQADREHVSGACETFELPFGETLYEPGDAITHVYFPTTGFISLITPVGAAESLEVGMVGFEGMFGITLLLNVAASPLRGLVQGGGAALRMTARRFTRTVKESAPFHQALNRYMFVLTSQLAQSAACARFHLLDARLARWLLMTQDRAQADTFRLTHKFLAYMLGVRRAGVTETAGRLEKKNLIRYAPGMLSILDRAGLEELSCPCYSASKSTYAQHLGELRYEGSRTNGRRVFAK